MPHTRRFFIESMSSPRYGQLVATGTLVVLLPVGSVEPHGPHMSLGTDTLISVAAAKRAAFLLEEAGYTPAIAPAIPYGVTDCAAAFPGAISIAGPVLTQMVGAVADAYLAGGARHVCVVNNHLEPAQDVAVRAALQGRSALSVACPLTRKWARTLTPEFKSGACHAGQYETSIVLACDSSLVDSDVCQRLPDVNVSLAEKLLAGTTDFVEMGLTDAYAGSPAAASAAEGSATLDRLAEMIVGEVAAVFPR
jgi:creatinine amidohydrolase